MVAVLAVAAAAFVCFLNIGSDSSSAADGSGSCGEDLDWTYTDSTKTLTIFGSGTTMDDYDLDMYPQEWPNTAVIIDMSGATNMTNIGSYAFYDFGSLKKVTFGPAYQTSGDHAFVFVEQEEPVDISFYWHNGKIEVGGNDCKGRTFQYKEFSDFWMTGVKVGDTVGCGDYRCTVLSVSGSRCYLKINGFLPGKSVPEDGTLLIEPGCKIWNNSSDNDGYGTSGSFTKIGENAFMGLNSLTDLKVGGNVSDIEASAFKDCINLKELTVPINVDLASGTPFKGCVNIEKMKFTTGSAVPGDEGKKGFDYGGERGFDIYYQNAPMYLSKDKLKSVEIEGYIQKIGDNTFRGCIALESVNFYGSVERLKTIGDFAFASSGLTSISTPGTLGSISRNAFSNCASLASAEIKGTGLSIGPWAFYNCTALTSLILHEGVTDIGSLAFGSIGIKKASLPDSAVISDLAFYECAKLKGFEVQDSNTRYNADGKGVLYSEDGKTVVAAPYLLQGAYSVSEGATSIGMAFRMCLVNNISLPSGVTEIGEFAFYGCSNLKFLDAPGVKVIAKDAFKDVELNELYLPALNAADSSVDAAAFNETTFWLGDTEIGCDSVGFKAVAYWFGEESGKLYLGICDSGIRYVTSADGTAVSAIRCEGGLEDVVIPDVVAFNGSEYRVTDINRILDNSRNMEKLSMGANVTGIIMESFDYMGSLKSIEVSDGNADYASVSGALYSKDLKTLLRYPIAKGGPVSFAPGIETIGSSAFYDCKGISCVVLPGSVKTLGNYSFGSDMNPAIGAFLLPVSLETVDVDTFAWPFYDGETALDDVKDIRGRFWVINSANDGYVRSTYVPDPVNGNVSFEAADAFEIDALAITKLEGNSATVSMNNGTVVFSKEAVSGLNAGTLTIGIADTSGYSEELKKKIGDRPVFAIDFGKNKTFAGKVTVTLPYVLKDGESADRVFVAYVDTAAGELREMEGTWKDGKVTFTTDHFSYFAVMYDAPASGSGDGIVYIAVGIAVAAAALIAVMYFLHIGPFGRKN